ncbi:MAG: hypothetical protein N3B16_12565 [Candidatus Aminicenantes bacterium]|nr:hypothetical protein [Candidatus Aminicenantes bacterium]
MIAIEICHNIIEAAGDIVLVRYDKTVGAKLIEIAARPKPNMQNLLVRAYAQGLCEFSLTTLFPLTYEQAEQLIREEENNFRTYGIAYGWLLQQNEAIILENVINEFKQLATLYLGSVGIPVPPEPLLTLLLQISFKAAIGLIENDYMPEVMATIEMVKKNMVKEVK